MSKSLCSAALIAVFLVTYAPAFVNSGIADAYLTSAQHNRSLLSYGIQAGADGLRYAADWFTSTASDIANDALATLTEPAKNLALSTMDFAVKHPGFAALSLGAAGYYIYSSWKKGIQLQEEKRKQAGDLLALCLDQIKQKKDGSGLSKTHAACLKTAARDIIDYYDWAVTNPLSWSEAVLFYNNRFRVVYTAKELIKEIENNASEVDIASTARNLLLKFKQLPA